MYFAGKTLYAHTLEGRDKNDWEILSAHLGAVAVHAEQYASAFGAADWGWVLGHCHDLGKASSEFQAKLHAANQKDAEDAGVEEHATAANQRVDHSTFGARYVTGRIAGLAGEMLAYCIAGHHAGLPNGRITDDATSGSTLEARLDPERTRLPHVDDPGLDLPELQVPFTRTRTDVPFALAFFTRMLFSCLIDADRACTEAFCDPSQSLERQTPRPSIATLRQQLDSHMASLQNAAAMADKQRCGQPNVVNLMRRHVLGECLSRAGMERGFFSLQVPTGGGKTLASLTFALHHAEHWQGRRIVVAIPFTSIIEQTADVYRHALGPLASLAMVEHHSNLQPSRDTRANQLGTENWDAPLVVTTNVQLFESMFSAATTPCRKLHRLANSVVILDEAQTLPVDLLAPTLAALRELVAHYGCTVVLCTATQPALEKRDDFPIGLSNVRPIVSNVPTLYAALKRVEIRDAGQLDDEVLVQRLAVEHRVLAIVNTRAHAAKVYAELVRTVGEAGCFHLSTRMCGAHRRDVLKRVRETAMMGPCRVISTQLIEAGVDLDLPVVYRAEAGFDSLAQAAGRCNREGHLPGLGITYIFQAQEPPPPGYLRETAATARELLPKFREDPLSPAAIEAYFRQHYWKSSDLLDRHGVLPLTSMHGAKTKFQFRETAKQYRIICDEQVPILVPYGVRGKNLLDALQGTTLPFVSHRQLQPYLVSVPYNALHAMEKQHVVQEHESGVWLLLSPDAYNNTQGLMLDNLGGGRSRRYCLELLSGVSTVSFGIRVQCWGDWALFTRPEMKVERVSYDVMTPSSARGVLEAIYWKPEIRWVIDRITVHRPIRFTSVRRNEVKDKISAVAASRVMNGGTGDLAIIAADGDTRQQMDAPRHRARSAARPPCGRRRSWWHMRSASPCASPPAPASIAGESCTPRGLMSAVRCIAFRHEKVTGNARADELFDMVSAKLKPELAAESKPPRSRHDYTIELTGDLPKGVTVEEWIPVRTTSA